MVAVPSWPGERAGVNRRRRSTGEEACTIPRMPVFMVCPGSKEILEELPGLHCAEFLNQCLHDGILAEGVGGIDRICGGFRRYLRWLVARRFFARKHGLE